MEMATLIAKSLALTQRELFLWRPFGDISKLVLFSQSQFCLILDFH